MRVDAKTLFEFIGLSTLWLVVIFLIGHLAIFNVKEESILNVYSQSALWNESEKIQAASTLKYMKYDTTALKKRMYRLHRIRHSIYHNWTTIANKTVIFDAIAENFQDCLHSDEKMQPARYNLEPSHCPEDVDLIWLIKSSIVRNSLRNFIRKSYARDSFSGVKTIYRNIRKIKRFFLMGSASDADFNPMLLEEGKKFDDILQGDFVDTFASATHKVFMGLQFVKEKCPNVKYVLIVDDDTVVLPWNLFPYLPIEPVDSFYGGFFRTSFPVRDANNRWYISKKAYACITYPQYAIGTMIVMSYNTSVSIYNEGIKYKYFPMDDVIIGGVARSLQINNSHFLPEHYSECDTLMQSHNAVSLKNLVVCHGAEFRKDQELLWTEFCRSTAPDSNVAVTIFLYCKEFLDF